MDGKLGGLRRRLCRDWEPNRLEDQVWALAYEEILPRVRKVLRTRKPAVPEESVQRFAETDVLARRA